MAEPGGGTLPVQDTQVPWVIRRSQRARRYLLRPLRDGSIEVVIPRRGSRSEGLAFLRRQADWARRQHLVHLARSEEAVVGFADGASLLVDGRQRTLWVEAVEGNRTRVTAEAAGAVIRIRHPPGEQWRPALVAWLKRQARTRLTERVEHWSGALGVEPRRIAIKDTRSRWGSASSKRNLNFTWRLILAPPAVLDYLALHEVCHLRHPDHSPAYWELVASLMPEYRQRKTWLKGPGETLLRAEL